MLLEKEAVFMKFFSDTLVPVFVVTQAVLAAFKQASLIVFIESTGLILDMWILVLI
jgi:hypothetical protein